jgi:hypothetical protein
MTCMTKRHDVQRSTRLCGALLAALVLAACAADAAKGRCLEHFRAEYGNDTRWVACPVKSSQAPWMGGNQ